ncbi:MAG: glycosyltransferase family 2 protein [Patescibacteria group bacterium]
MTKLTALVVTFNEEKHLDECLSALDFCQEKIVIDLGSTDNSVAIASRHNFRVITHPWTEIVEPLRSWAIAQASHDWIVFMDPDEIFPVASRSEVVETIAAGLFGGLTLERVNYFIGRPIKHGRWFGHAGFPRVFNKNSVILSGSIHDGLKRKKEYRYRKISGVIKHYWVDSLNQFYEKHNRYLKHEGASRYNRGERFSRFGMYRGLTINFIRWYLLNHGFLDRKDGWQLIKLALWYEKNAWLSLKKYQEDLIP